MTTRFLRSHIIVTLDDVEYTVRDAEIVLDSSESPYVSAEVTLPLLTDELIDWLDPRTDVRVLLGGSELGSEQLVIPFLLPQILAGGDGRLFDLSLRSRSVNHEAKTVTLRLTSDEAILQTYAPLTDDTTPRTLESSLRDVVEYALALAIPGATLEPGDDADVTAQWSVTNLVPDPAATSAANFAPHYQAGSLTAMSGTAIWPDATTYLRWTASTDGTTTVRTAPVSATPGRTYSAAAYLRTATTDRDGRVGLQFLSGTGAALATIVGANVSLPTSGGGVLATVTAVAPAGAERVQIVMTGVGASSGQAFVASGFILNEGELVPVFSGATTAAGAYTYAWQGDANASPSTRTPDVDRPREALTIKAGQTVWDFLMTLRSSVGMMLWCDETRVWRLQTPESRTLPSLISVSASTTREGTDEIDLTDDLTGVTGVIVRYSWTDTDDVPRTRDDTAGVSGKVRVIDVPQPFPGPGVAAAVLARSQGTGRVQDVTTFTRWDATPGMQASISLPGAPDTLGRIIRVEFGTDGFMRLGTSALIDVIPGSWASVDPGLMWGDVDPDLVWEDA